MEQLLDTVVRLAAFGTSGVCIFAVFWIGMIMRKPNKDASPEWYRSMRHYMTMCVLCGVITGASGVANAMFNADKTAAQAERAEQANNRAIKETERAGVAVAAANEASSKAANYAEQLARYSSALQAVRRSQLYPELERTLPSTVRPQLDSLAQLQPNQFRVEAEQLLELQLPQGQ
ncbi:MAG: hypothetical protein AAF004_11705 [Pseudomonadota bacterium]